MNIPHNEFAKADPDFAEFLKHHPSYADNQEIDQLRAREFARLENSGEIYLDYTGGGLYPACLIDQHAELLKSRVFGNPHSHNNSSQLASSLLEQARKDVLEYFRADTNDYVVIFTANASAALKLIAESYPFDERSELLLTADNHNSVQGIREFARSKGASIRYISCQPNTLLADDIDHYLNSSECKSARLFAFPAQSNFSGVQHPLSWIAQAKSSGYDVLLDAAAFVPNNRLDLSALSPDFVSVSFYKMFGYPTGVGALIARRDALTKLKRPWFAGGTVKIVSAIADFYTLADGEAAFEEGTVNYLTLPAVSAGLKFIEAINVDNIHERVMALTDHLLRNMQSLHHSNGQSAIELYGPKTTQHRGATIAFNCLDTEGKYIHYDDIEKLANDQGLAIRSGCFCNPGAGESSLSHTAETINQCRERINDLHKNQPFDLVNFQQCITSEGKATGAVRASLGLVSNFTDIQKLLAFLRSLLDQTAEEIATKTRTLDGA